MVVAVVAFVVVVFVVVAVAAAVARLPLLLYFRSIILPRWPKTILFRFFPLLVTQTFTPM